MLRRGQPKIDAGDGEPEERTCAWEPCGNTFKPTIILSGVSTEHFCSPLCAYASLKARPRRFRVTIIHEEDTSWPTI